MQPAFPSPLILHSVLYCVEESTQVVQIKMLWILSWVLYDWQGHIRVFLENVKFLTSALCNSGFHNLVSRYLANPREAHVTAVKRIFRYLLHTPTHGLTFSKKNSPIVQGFCDADYANSVDDRKSVGAYVFLKVSHFLQTFSHYFFLTKSIHSCLSMASVAVAFQSQLQNFWGEFTVGASSLKIPTIWGFGTRTLGQMLVPLYTLGLNTIHGFLKDHCSLSQWSDLH